MCSVCIYSWINLISDEFFIIKICHEDSEKVFFRIFLNQHVLNISMWFLRCMFWLKNCWIIIFCLLQFNTVTHISCTITVNFLWLIFTAWFIAESQIKLYFNFFLITIMLIVTRIFLLDSYLATITLFLIVLFFILFIFLIIYKIK